MSSGGIELVGGAGAPLAPAPVAQVMGMKFEVCGFYPKGGVLHSKRLDGTPMPPDVPVPAGSLVAILPPETARHLLGQLPPHVLSATTRQ